MYSLLMIILIVAMIAGIWKTFAKAGQPGWAAIVPIYNIYVMTKVAGRPGWWLLLFLVPFINLVISIVLSVDIAKAFGKSTLFGVLALWLLSGIGYLVLGFSDAKYVGRDNPPTEAAATPTA